MAIELLVFIMQQRRIMKTVFRLVLLMTCISFLPGCAMLDTYFFNPAASHASVDPLFRTIDCKDYEARSGKTNFKIEENGGFFIKDRCEHQALSINDHIFYSAKNLPEENKSANTGGSQANSLSGNANAETAGVVTKGSSVPAVSSSAGKLGQISDNNEKLAETNPPDPAKDGASKANENTKTYDPQFVRLCKPYLDDKDHLLLKDAQNCLNYLISRSNEICSIHKSHIFGDRAVFNTITGTLALGAGIAGTMTGTGAAHLLSGTAGFLTGGQALVDKEIYRNLVTQAILLKIDNNRSDFLKSPKLAYLNEDTSNYQCTSNGECTEGTNSMRKIGYAKVRNDAVEYHNLCSFYDGLKSLFNDAGGSNKTETVNAVLVNQFEAKRKLVQSEIEKIKNELNETGTSPEDKTKLESKLKSKEGELSNIMEVLSAIGGSIDKKPETGETTISNKASLIETSVVNPKVKVSNEVSTEDVQKALLKAGYDPGAVDNKLGKKTKAAIKTFQKLNSLATTGKPDANTLKLLGL